MSNSDIHTARWFYTLTLINTLKVTDMSIGLAILKVILTISRDWVAAICKEVYENICAQYLQVRKMVVFSSICNLCHNRISANFCWNKFRGSPKICKICSLQKRHPMVYICSYVHMLLYLKMSIILLLQESKMNSRMRIDITKISIVCSYLGHFPKGV